MWHSLWRNINIASCHHQQLGIIRNAALAVTDNKIAWIGEEKDLPKQIKAKNNYDGNKQWLLPGFIDCHTHLIYAGNRANEFALRLQGKTYADISKAGGGILSTVKATRAANFEALYIQSEKRLKRLLAEGVTTVEIKSGYGLDLATEIKMLRVAKKLEENFPVTIKKTFLGAHTIPAEYTNNAEGYIDFICNEVLPIIAQEKLADAVDGFCESIAFSPAQIERVFKKSLELNLPVKLHAEQLSNLKSATLAAHYHALSADHLEYADEESIIAMSRSNTVAVLLPGAYYFLRETKKPPIDLLRKHKVPFAIASDCNPGTSPITSILTIMNMACVLFQLTPEEIFQSVTLNAAKALGIEKTHGSLEVGKTADFVIWDIEEPIDLIYNVGLNPVNKIVKNGA